MCDGKVVGERAPPPADVEEIHNERGVAQRALQAVA